MGLDGIFGNEEAVGDFAVGESGGDEAEDFEFAGSDTEVREASGIWGEGDRGGRRGGEGLGLAAGEGEAKPDAQGGEDGGDECAVNFQGMLHDKEAVFGQLENGDEEARGDAIKKNAAEGTTAQDGAEMGTSGHWGT